MKNSKSCSPCTLVLILFVIVVILGCIRYFDLQREKFESHYNANNKNPALQHRFKKPHFNPCSPKNFGNSLESFYQDIKDYRTSQKDLEKKLIEYEESYNKLAEKKHKLEKSREVMNNCISVL